MKPEKKALLEEIGFMFKPQDEKWLLMYDKVSCIVFGVSSAQTVRGSFEYFTLFAVARIQRKGKYLYDNLSIHSIRLTIPNSLVCV